MQIPGFLVYQIRVRSNHQMHTSKVVLSLALGIVTFAMKRELGVVQEICILKPPHSPESGVARKLYLIFDCHHWSTF